MNNLLNTLTIIILFLIGTSATIQAQTDKELLAELAAEEQEAINALVLYPAGTRRVILESTLHPEALIKIESIQNRSSAAFREIMESLPQNSQQILWDLTRYPGLIHQLAKRRRESRESLDIILSLYPEVIHKRAREAAENHDLPLVVVDELNYSAESAFRTILADYPPSVQKSLQDLIALPEVITILTENIRLTLLVGHVYQKEPDWIMQKADSLNLEIARQNAQEIEDWKASLEDDPKAMEELTASIHSYNEEYGYDDEYYDAEEEHPFEEFRTEVVVRHHYYFHYPYWLGYPHWYAYPRWHYYPSWYDWGLHYYPSRPIIVVGLPSFHFTTWFFRHSHHHHHYSHLSAHFVKHYHGHRRSGAGISTSVGNWRYKNREVISDKWMENDGRLSNRFKEYGKFESAREKYNKKHPKRTVSRKEYIRQNEKKFPALSKSKKEQDIRINNRYKKQVNTKVTPQRSNKYPTNKEKDQRPRIHKPDKKQPTAKKQQPKDQISPKTKRPTLEKKNKTPLKVPKVNKGKDYHKNKWNKSKTKHSKSNTPSRPKPKTKRNTKKPKVKTSRKKPDRGN